MSNLTCVVTFTQSSGQPATGLTLVDIDLYLTRTDRATGASTVVWDGTQNPTAEVTNMGQYIRILATADLDNYVYHLIGNYTGAATLDSNWSTPEGAGQSDIDMAMVADVVWDEAIAGHLGVGSTGEALNNVSAGASPSQIADAVWDELLSGHVIAGSAGEKLGSISAAVFPAGAVNFTYTVINDVTLNPIDGVEVWISTDNPATNIIWKGNTDAFGVARDVNGNLPALDAGTYYFWRQLAGYIFTDPDTEVVS